MRIIGYAMHSSRSHDAVIRVCDAAGNVIDTHEHAGDFQRVVRLTFLFVKYPRHIEGLESQRQPRLAIGI